MLLTYRLQGRQTRESHISLCLTDPMQNWISQCYNLKCIGKYNVSGWLGRQKLKRVIAYILMKAKTEMICDTKDIKATTEKVCDTRMLRLKEKSL